MMAVESILQRYADFRPTGFDGHINIDNEERERENWFLVPVLKNRDSVSLELANFASVVESLGGESETLEIHRFGHWGNGWFEIIIIDPSRESDGEDIVRALDNYPVFDDNKLSEFEIKDEDETWENCACSEFESAINQEFSTNLDIKDYDAFRGMFYCVMIKLSRYIEHTNEGACFPVDDVVSALTDEDIKPFIDCSVSISVDSRYVLKPLTFDELATMPRCIVAVSIIDWSTDTTMSALTPPVIPSPF